MITDGLQILVIGMGVVFIMLALLVGSVSLTAWTIKAFGLEGKPPSGETPSTGQPGTGAVAAAISAAIAKFRGERKGS
ncbi:MAG: OadG family protein [bacterium]